MKNINWFSFFDEHFLLKKLTKSKDPLDEHIDWRIFALILDVVFNKSKNSNKIGRPPFDQIMMFKLFILQSLYNLPDDQMEYLITDWLSFKRFFSGSNQATKFQTSKTIWRFRETLTQEAVIETLFYRFNTVFDDQSIFAKVG